MYKALDLASYIIGLCIDEQEYISNLQLQKILYFIQKKFLKERNEIAFAEPIEAWKHGPVVPEVYYRYCASGSMSIVFAIKRGIVEEQDKQLIDSVVREKRKMSPWELVDETHVKGGAWDKVFKGGIGYGKVIPPELIKNED